MNGNCARVCPSPEWAAHTRNETLPTLTRHADLADNMLQIGPGHGAATEWLSQRVERPTLSYFLYTLVLPRPEFGVDCTDAEAAVMREHVNYWQGLLEARRVVAFGPVSGLADAGGIAVVEAAAEEDVRRLGEADPAVASGLTTFRVCAMPGAFARS